MVWRDLDASYTAIREDGAKVGGFPGDDGTLEYWGYPPGWSPRNWDGADPTGPFRTLPEAKASLGTMLPLTY